MTTHATDGRPASAGGADPGPPAGPRAGAVRMAAAEVLDERVRRAAVDRSAMLEAIARLPDQLRDGIERAGSMPEVTGGRPIRHVAVLGMGGSAIGADIVRASFADRLRVPLTVLRQADVPAWVGPDTLVVASSHSGETEETLHAFAAAAERGARCVAVTTGGSLADFARRAGMPLVTFHAPGQPRAAVGHGAALLLGLLSRAGLVDAHPAAELGAAAAAVDAELATSGPDVPSTENRAKRLAVTVAERLVITMGSDHLEPVARRWKTQLNENAKVWAGWDELPELDHNSVVGFGGPAWTPERLFVIALEAEGEPPRMVDRRATALEILAGTGTEAQVVHIPAGSRFAQALAAVALGDLVSVYVAVVRGVDPTPVDAITTLKVRLAEGRSGA